MSSSPTPTASSSALAGPSMQGSRQSADNGDEKNRCAKTTCLSLYISSDSSNHCLSSVVIKVGMVGDSQIGKTSLMVKYVEGSFDEDYIQTLGASSIILRHSFWLTYTCFACQASTSWRKQSLSDEQRLHSQSGTWVVSVNSSICFR
jgi:hypothetical protein